MERQTTNRSSLCVVCVFLYVFVLETTMITLDRTFLGYKLIHKCIVLLFLLLKKETFIYFCKIIALDRAYFVKHLSSIVVCVCVCVYDYDDVRWENCCFFPDTKRHIRPTLHKQCGNFRFGAFCIGKKPSMRIRMLE